MAPAFNLNFNIKLAADSDSEVAGAPAAGLSGPCPLALLVTVQWPGPRTAFADEARRSTAAAGSDGRCRDSESASP